MLSDEELNEKLARLTYGWISGFERLQRENPEVAAAVENDPEQRVLVEHNKKQLVDPNVDIFGCVRYAPDFATSIDLQKAPGGPEELAREKGWWLEVKVEGDGWVRVSAVRYISPTRRFDRTANKSEARARVEALLAALEAEEPNREEANGS